jgi:4-hydroxythreonine-4-phosphate dehydrogenase
VKARCERAGDLITLAVTLGDPRGIGPEVVTGALVPFLDECPDSRIHLMGDEDGLDAPLPPQVTPVPVGRFDGSLRSAGVLSLDAIREAVDRTASGQAQGIVTGPVHKPALHEAGVRLPGQTELLQQLTGAPAVGMLMHAHRTRLGPRPLRILLATTHLPLRQVPDTVTRELLTTQIRLLHGALVERWGLAAPRIGLCGMNPHASDGGLFGSEEARIMTPALEELKAEGLAVQGPLPADTVFLRAVEGHLDAVVAPYHDVGMAVFKTLAFGRGVNTTLGLPFPRTSPDHGTAFDLVGTGRADPGSTLEALRLARSLVLGRGAATPTSTSPPPADL